MMLQNMFQALQSALADMWRVMRHHGPSQIQFWVIALCLGVVCGFVAVAFRMGVSQLEGLFYGRSLSWYWIIAIPTVGGLLVGLILTRFTPDARARSVADVIKGAALDDGRVEVKAGLASAAASLLTLGMGGSTGREGPVVHLAAVVSTWVSNAIRADGITGRDLLGCAVAAAVSASFNAPIAGTLFALEVILRHFAVHAFAPIVIASVTGTIVSRLVFGDVTEFVLQDTTALKFYAELPAFLMLGLVCGLVSVVFMKSIFVADRFAGHVQQTTGVPNWLRPAISGACLGLIAVWFPHIIGVGYETISGALTGSLGLREVIIFAIIKTLAVAITMAGRMGGGVFSPALMIGALIGLGFGIIATSIFPNMSGAVTLYALSGMGAVAAAVLGAPISTTLIVFELTGDWQTGLAVMVAVSLSTALASRMVDRSFFLTQLERRNIHLAAGPQRYLLATVTVASVMRPIKSAPTAEECWALIEQGLYVDGNATLEAAMPIFEAATTPYLPVVTLGGEDHPPELWGCLFQVDALKAYNRAMAATAAEEHS